MTDPKQTWLRKRAEEIEHSAEDAPGARSYADDIERLAREFAERALRKHEVNCGYSFDEALVSDQEIAEALEAAERDEAP